MSSWSGACYSMRYAHLRHGICVTRCKEYNLQTEYCLGVSVNSYLQTRPSCTYLLQNGRLFHVTGGTILAQTILLFSAFIKVVVVIVVNHKFFHIKLRNRSEAPRCFLCSLMRYVVRADHEVCGWILLQYSCTNRNLFPEFMDVLSTPAPTLVFRTCPSY